MIKIVEGNILDASEDIIGHQVNCQGVMGAGLAKQIRQKYPGIFLKYTSFVNGLGNKDMLLGNAQVLKVDDDKYIANLFGQLNYGRTGRFTDYPSLDHALRLLKEKAKKYNLTVALPHGIGCGLAGGDWNIVYDMIEDAFEDYEVTLYKFKYGGTIVERNIC
jgi:O-acetyl-ADP-ribose deacetylase (regulator of RNase III)